MDFKASQPSFLMGFFKLQKLMPAPFLHFLIIFPSTLSEITLPQWKENGREYLATFCPSCLNTLCINKIIGNKLLPGTAVTLLKQLQCSL